MAKKQIKPLGCPFCGRKPKLQSGLSARLFCDNMHCPADTAEAIGDSTDEAIQNWNRRAPVLGTAALALLQLAAGYEEGFVEAPNATLKLLESYGFIERNGTTRGRNTHWRITDAGQNV